MPGVLTKFAEWLFFTSIKSIVVIALILIVQSLFHNRLAAKWKHALWFLLVARLIIPFDMPFSLSLFNLTQDVQYYDVPLFPTFNMESRQSLAIPIHTQIAKDKNLVSNTEVIFSEPEFVLSPKEIALLLWLVVVFLLTTYTIVMNIKLSRKISKSKNLKDKQILSILQSCKEKLGIASQITVRVMDSITSPFWYGIFKNQIILPAHLLDNQNRDKLEHIFMHELVHYKQKDVPLAYIATMLQILHWFNPVIWLAFFKMRADREAACDEIVLTNIGKDKNKQYGRTLISLIESSSQRGLLPVAVGLADTKFNLKRRVTMIAHFSPKSIWWTAVALLLISTIAVFALTSAVQNGNITGKIICEGKSQPDSFYVNIYPATDYSSSYFNKFSQPLATYASHKHKFAFTLQPGVYKAVARAHGYKSASVPFVVVDETEKTFFQFTLFPINTSEIPLLKVNGGKKVKSYDEAYRILMDFITFEKNASNESSDGWLALKVIKENILQSMKARQSQIDPEFQMLFDLYYLHFCYRMLPPTYYLLDMLPHQTPSKEELRQFVTSNEFLPYIEDLKNRLFSLNPKSPLLTGEFIDGWKYLTEVTTWYPGIEQDLGFSSDELYYFLLNFIKQIPSKELREKLIYGTAIYYSYFWGMFDKEKSQHCMAWLKSDYIDFYNSKKEDLTILDDRLKISTNVDAPDLNVETIKGETFKLSDQKGKWTFVIFWDPDNFSQNQIAYIKGIEDYNKTQITFIGLVPKSAGYSKKEIALFAEQHNIPFDNALVEQDIIDSFGVETGMNTFVVASDNRLVIQNLHGEKTTNVARAVFDVGRAEYRGRMYE